MFRELLPTSRPACQQLDGQTTRTDIFANDCPDEICKITLQWCFFAKWITIPKELIFPIMMVKMPYTLLKWVYFGGLWHLCDAYPTFGLWHLSLCLSDLTLMTGIVFRYPVRLECTISILSIGIIFVVDFPWNMHINDALLTTSYVSTVHNLIDIERFSLPQKLGQRRMTRVSDIVDKWLKENHYLDLISSSMQFFILFNMMTVIYIDDCNFLNFIFLT